MEPALSSSTLFHFTSSMEAVTSILEHELEPRYCLEHFESLFGRNPDPRTSFALPMVCFCDIPLSQTWRHMRVYGRYGIGMAKSWGMRKGVTPVLYVHPESSTARAITSLVEDLPRQPQDPVVMQLWENVGRVAGFTKPYSGDFRKNGVTHQNVRFYDEREWRYIPVDPSTRRTPILAQDRYRNLAARRDANLDIKHLKLGFDPWDIRYIIVANDDEILPMVQEIERIKDKYEHDEVRLLSTRIISVDQIIADF